MAVISLLGLDATTLEIVAPTLRPIAREIRIRPGVDERRSPVRADDWGDCVVVDVSAIESPSELPAGIEQVRAIAASFEGTLVAVTRRATALAVSHVLSAGATAVVDVPGNPISFRSEVEHALSLGARRSAERERMRAVAARLDSLGEDVREVLVMLLEGYSNKETAIRLRLGLRTVERHRAEILARLKVNSLVDAALTLAWLTGRTELGRIQAAVRGRAALRAG